MKKTFAIVLVCLVMALSLAGCGKDKKDPPSGTDVSPSPVVTPVNTPAVTDGTPIVSPGTTNPNVTDGVDARRGANNNGNAVQGADRSSQRTATRAVTP